MERTFEIYLESGGKSKSTCRHYGVYIDDFLQYLNREGVAPFEASPTDIMSFMKVLQLRKLSNATRSIRLGVIKQYYGWLLSEGVRSDNPAEHIWIRGAKRRKLHNILEPHELERLYVEYPEPKEDDPRKNSNWYPYYLLSKRRNKAVLSLLIHQGVTTPEIARITLGDLQLREGRIIIRGSRKGNERSLDLKPNQIMLLMEYQYQVREKLLTFQEDPTDQLFLPTPVVGRNKASKSLQIFKGLTKELQQLEPQFENFKQVRASVITHWIKHYNLREVQYMAGHRYISSTESYLVHHLEDLKDDIDKFHPF